MTEKNSLDSCVNNDFLTSRNVPFARRLIPGYNSLRRVELQGLSEDNLSRKGHNDFDVDDPALDGSAVLFDLALISGYSFLAYGLYESMSQIFT